MIQCFQNPRVAEGKKRKEKKKGMSLEKFVFQEAPENVLEEVAAFCEDRALINLGRTCRRLHQICDREIKTRPPVVPGITKEEEREAKEWLEKVSRDGLKIRMKVVVIGEHLAGKKSMCQYFINGHPSLQQEATIGASFCKKKVTIFGTEVSLAIWDTGGGEKYRALAPMYYRGADVVVVVFTITDPESFKVAQKWVGDIQSQKTKSLIVLVGNKSDLEDKREVSFAKAQAWGKENHAAYIEVSSATGKNIDAMFKFVAKRAAVGRCNEPLPPVDQPPSPPPPPHHPHQKCVVQ